MQPLIETAYAKINLALHVRCRRSDGYHQLETLFAFLDKGDHLALTPASEFQLSANGEFGDLIASEPVDNNLVTRAAQALCYGELPKVELTLGKYLPVAAGLGGGSADAAATIRILARQFNRNVNDPEIMQLAAELGADVPACINSMPVIGLGTGTQLEPVINDIQGLACLLVNPRTALSTGPVFQGWDGVDHGPLPTGTAREIMFAGRNDLEAPATILCPEIAEIVVQLNKTGALLTRMSGSGATCFALYDDINQAEKSATDLQNTHPHWWWMTGWLR